MALGGAAGRSSVPLTSTWPRSCRGLRSGRGPAANQGGVPPACDVCRGSSTGSAYLVCARLQVDLCVSACVHTHARAQRAQVLQAARVRTGPVHGKHGRLSRRLTSWGERPGGALGQGWGAVPVVFIQMAANGFMSSLPAREGVASVQSVVLLCCCVVEFIRSRLVDLPQLPTTTTTATMPNHPCIPAHYHTRASDAPVKLLCPRSPSAPGSRHQAHHPRICTRVR